LTFTFAIHCRAATYEADEMRFAFYYDNDSLEVVGARPMGAWTANNYDNLSWPNISSGRITVDGLTNYMTQHSQHVSFGTSCVVPFFQVTLHVKSAQESQLNAFGVAAGTLFSHYHDRQVYYWDFDYFGGAVHEVPEPASMLLVFGGLALAGGRTLRSRRNA
jgi:hypothetical protein